MQTKADPSKVLKLYPTDDGAIRQKQPDVYWGSSTILIISNQYGSNNSTDWKADALIKFDLSSIPQDSKISSANLNLYYFGKEDTDPVGRIITCYRITSDWDEKTIHWNNQPNITDTATSTAIVPEAEKNWMKWNVTEDVLSFINRDKENYGWILQDNTYWGTGYIPQQKYHSRENEFSPYLQIEFETYDTTNTENNLVSYWNFNEGTAKDQIHNNNGILYGNITYNATAGLCNSGCFEFDGIDDHIEVPDTPSLDITDEITISAWVKFYSIDKFDPPFIISKNGDNGYDDELFKIGIDDYGLGYLDFRINSEFIAGFLVKLDTWYNVIGTYDGFNKKLYVNGNLIIEERQNGKIGNSNNSIFIGADMDAVFNQHFNGLIDEIRIYDKALNISEIIDLYIYESGGLQPLYVTGGGPYTGEINQSVQLYGYASGGKPPYEYSWDLNNDGLYDNINSARPVLSIENYWPENGTFQIRLKVTDATGYSLTDETVYSRGTNGDIIQNQSIPPVLYYLLIVTLLITISLLILYNRYHKSTKKHPKINDIENITRCSICLGKIKKDSSSFTCECGAIFHDSCIKRVRKCPECSTEYDMKK